MLYGIVQGLVEVCGWFELLFVNTFGMPYNSGVFAYLLIVTAVLIWGIWETMRQDVNGLRMKISFILSVSLLGIPFIGNGYLVGLLIIAAITIFIFYYKRVNIKAINTILISLMVITIGYSTFALILIRSNADTPMNQNNPNNIFTLGTYLARQQYGERPLLYGRTYISEQKLEFQGGYGIYQTESKITWAPTVKNSPDEKDKYIVISENGSPIYVEETCMLFPRMYSPEANHVQAYKDWAQITGTPIKYNNGKERKSAVMPTFGENLRFFFNYQLNFMYWRYFMWNFSGRQNDLQSDGNVLNGNWITGIKFLDQARVGPQDNMHDDIAKNKGHNKYYMLPLLLGIIGILFQVMKKEKQGIQSFWITFMLFFMTGIAIVLYLNQTPEQPRERDYAYAGSFYAFCIWIGIGVAGMAKAFEKAKLPPLAASIAASVLCIIVPLQMASQTWDDHDRSGRYIARDFGRNYLESCEPNAIIFTQGDNDTFPLWYAQEVEGVRTDVRVCNTSYLQTDWYIDQMKRQAYNSDPLPISWERKDYAYGKRAAVYLVQPQNHPVNLGAVLNYIKSDDPKTKQTNGKNTLYLSPYTNLVLPVDSAKVVESRTLNPEHEPFIEKQMNFSLEGRNLVTIVDLISMDMINTNNWKRPIYYAVTVPPSAYYFTANYLQKTGLAYQVVPLSTKESTLSVNTTKMFDNVMNKFKWGGVEKPGVYLDETAMNQCKSQRVNIFSDLAYMLIREGKNDKAIQILDKCVEVFPEENVPYDVSVYNIAGLYFEVGELEKGKQVAKKMIDRSITNVDWMMRLNPSQKMTVKNKLERELSVLQGIISVCNTYDKEFAEQYIERVNNFIRQYQAGQNR